MAKGALRQSIENWAHETFIAPEPTTWWGRVQKRWSDYFASWDKFYATHPTTAHLNFWAQYTNAIVYALTGNQALKQGVDDAAAGKDPADVEKQLADWIDKFFTNPQYASLIKVMGTAITEPILATLEQFAGDDQADPKNMARAFHGVMMSLTTASTLADTLAEATSIGAIKSVGTMFTNMYWNLGLGFLGWQTLAPLLEAGLKPGLTRYYNRKYQPQRFSASDWRDLYALGEATLQDVYDEGRNEGWRDKDLAKWVKLAFRSLAQGDIWDAYHKGFMDQTEAIRRLRVLGYDPADIPLLFKLNPAPEVNDAHAFSVSTARNAYEAQLLSRSQLTAILKGLKYGDLEITTLIALSDLNVAQKVKGLAVGQVKAAWGENVLNDTEARHYLGQAGLDKSQQDILLKTWQAELAPQARKLNSGTIGGAYVEGILTRAQASQKLTGLGYTQDDALLQLDLVEKRNPEAFGAAPPPPVRTLAPGTLSELLAVGLITADQMTARLVALNYSQADAALLTQAAVVKAAVPKKQLPQASVENAYVAGVLSRAQAAAYLKDLGFDDASAKIILDTDEQKNAGVFKQPPAQRALQLSAGTLSDLLILGLIDAKTMKADLLALGYSASDADLLVARSTSLATPLPRILTADNIRQAYLYGVIDRATAEADLEGIDYDPADAKTILDTLEAANPQVFHPDLVQSIRMPSISALASAVYNGLITETEFYARAQEIGYSPGDAALYLKPATNGSTKPTLSLTAAQLLAAYSAGLLDYGTTLDRLESMGYNEDDAILLIRTHKEEIRNGDVWFGLVSGVLDPNNAIAQLIAAGYSDNDIYNAFASLPASTLAAMGIDLPSLAGALAITPGGS
jgi:hypothetical protein